MRRVGKWILSVLGAIVLALALTTSFLLFTQPGARFVGKVVVPRVPGTLKYVAMAGRIMSHMTLDHVHFENDKMRVAIEHLDLKWKPRQLLDRTAHIERLEIRGVEVELLRPSPPKEESNEPQTKPGPPHSPIGVQVDEGRITDVTLRTPDSLEVHGAQIEFTGNLDSLRLRASASIRSPKLPEITVRALRATANLTDINVESLVLELLEGRLSVQGNAAWYPAVRWDATVRADSLHPGPVMPVPADWPGSVSLSLATKGSLTPEGKPTGQFDLTDLSGNLKGFPLHGRVRATAGPTDVNIESMVVDFFGGRLNVQGRASWDPTVRWDATVRADSLHPGPLMPVPAEWPGTVSLLLATHGSLTAGGEPTGHFDITNLSGNLKGFPLHGRATVDLEGKTSGTVDTSIDWGPLTVRGGGQAGDALDLSLDASVESLQTLLPQVHGTIDLTARVTGPRTGPRVAAVVNGRDMSMADTKADSLAARLSFGMQPTDSSSVDLHVLGITAAGQHFSSLHVEGSGRRTKHALTAALDGDSLDVNLALRGGYVDSTWSGTLERLDAQEVRLGSWAMRSPTHLSVAAAHASVDSLCLESPPTSVTLGGTWSKVAGWQARAHVADIDARFWKKRLPRHLDFDGRVFVDAAMTGKPHGKILGQAAAELRDGVIRLTTEDGEDQFTVRKAVVRCTAGEAKTDLDLEVGVDRAEGGKLLELGGAFQVTPGVVADSTVLAHQLRGSLHGEVTDLYFIDVLTPEIRRSSGRIDMDLRAEGPVGKPVLGGDVRLTDVNLGIPALGLELRELQLAATGDPRTEFKLSGHVLSGDGSLDIDGEAPLAPSEEKPVHVRIHAENFKVMNTPEIDAEISTDLDVSVSNKRARVAGTISLPLAKVELIEVPTTAIAPSADVVLVGRKHETKPPLETQADVTVALGDKVTFRGFGTYAKLEGQVRIQQEGVKLPTGSGEVRVTEGYYRAYGQNLKIEKGRISFTGSVANPTLEIRASREAADGTIAGVDIGGTAEAPKLKLYSDPTMAENDMLSYIITGRGTDKGTKEDAEKVKGAAAMLGGNVMTTYLGSKVGLDEARIESGTGSNDASLVAGKYITPKIYASYAISLFDQDNLMRLRYIMSPQWSVQTETGRTMGADLFYNVERGKGGKTKHPAPDEAGPTAASRDKTKKAP